MPNILTIKFDLSMSLHDRSSTSANVNKNLDTQFVSEDYLKTAEIQIERKTFVFTLKENPRGRLLRITEEVGGRRDTIIIPAPGLEEFKRIIDEMVVANRETPCPDSDAPQD